MRKEKQGGKERKRERREFVTQIQMDLLRM